MRRIVGILVPVVLVIGLLPGCSEDDAKPQITRLYASEGCGVAPLRVEFRGDASAGAPLDDPTGSNNWLSFTWNFGDGTVLSDATSVAYHEYQEPGTYTVTLTAEDNDGEKASRTTFWFEQRRPAARILKPRHGCLTCRTTAVIAWGSRAWK